MAIAATHVSRTFFNVRDGVPIDVDIPTFEKRDVLALYGSTALLAVENVDYIVSLSDDFKSFTITPKTALIDKIGLDTNMLVVKRELDLESDATPNAVRDPAFVSREFDRSVMRDQQLTDGLSRTLKVREGASQDVLGDVANTMLLGGTVGGYRAQNVGSAGARASKMVGFDSSGDLKAVALADIDPNLVDTTTLPLTLTSVASLRLYDNLPRTVLIDGYTFTTDETGGHVEAEDDGVYLIVDAAGRLWVRTQQVDLIADMDVIRGDVITLGIENDAQDAVTQILQDDLDLVSAAQLSGVIGIKGLANVPGGTADNSVIYVGLDAVPTNDGIYIKHPVDGLEKISDLLPAQFDTRVTSIENFLEEAFLSEEVDHDVFDPRPLDGAEEYNHETGAHAVALPGATGLYWPQGVDGDGSKWIMYFEFNASDAARLKGQTIKLLHLYETSINFLDEMYVAPVSRFNITYFSIDGVNETPNIVGDTYAQVTPDTMTAGLEVTMTGDPVTFRFDVGVTSNDGVDDIAFATPVKQYIVKANADTVDVLLQTAVAPSLIQLKELDSVCTYRENLINGTEHRASKRGITIPTGATGDAAFFACDIPTFTFSEGSKIRVTIQLKTSIDVQNETVLDVLSLGRFRDSNGFDLDVTDNLTQVSNTRIDVVLTRTVTAVDSAIGVTFSMDALQARTSEGFYEVGEVTLECLSSGVMHTVNEEMLKYAEAVNQYRRRRHLFRREDLHVVDPWGGAGYASLRTAIETKGGGRSPIDRMGYLIKPGVLTNEVAANVYIEPKPYTSIMSYKGAGEVVLDVRMPANTPDQSQIEGIRMIVSASLQGTTVLAANVRYDFHPDQGNPPDGDVQVVKDVTFIHYGNEGPNAWPSPSAIGAGGHSGYNLVLDNVRLESPTQGMGIHDNADFSQPMYIEYKGGYAVGTDPGGVDFALTFGSYGAGIVSEVVMDHNVVGGLVSFSTTQMLSKRREAYVLKAYGYRVKRYGPAFAWLSEVGRDGLTVMSDSSEGSTIALSGDALPNLFGPSIPFDGGVGWAARQHSYYAIDIGNGDPVGDVEKLHMGKPTYGLGNCTVDNKTLNIDFNGVTSVAITFVNDYTNLSNADILTELNQRLSAALAVSNATVTLKAQAKFDITTPWENRAEVHQFDAEIIALNLDDRMVVKGMALVHVNGGVKVAMFSDEVEDFAGIALEEALPGRPVRVQFRDKIAQAHLTVNDNALSWKQGLVFADDGVLTPVSNSVNPAEHVLRVFETRQLRPQHVLRFVNRS